MCLCFSVLKILLTSREKTADGILFKLGIYIHEISESIPLIFLGPKKNGCGGGGQITKKRLKLDIFMNCNDRKNIKMSLDAR